MDSIAAARKVMLFPKAFTVDKSHGCECRNYVLVLVEYA